MARRSNPADAHTYERLRRLRLRTEASQTPAASHLMRFWAAAGSAHGNLTLLDAKPIEQKGKCIGLLAIISLNAGRRGTHGCGQYLECWGFTCRRAGAINPLTQRLCRLIGPLFPSGVGRRVGGGTLDRLPWLSPAERLDFAGA